MDNRRTIHVKDLNELGQIIAEGSQERGKQSRPGVSRDKLIDYAVEVLAALKGLSTADKRKVIRQAETFLGSPSTPGRGGHDTVRGSKSDV